MSSIKYIEEGVEYSETPLSDEEMKSLNLSNCDGTNSDECGSHHKCINKIRYKCMWDYELKICRWYETSETC